MGSETEIFVAKDTGVIIGPNGERWEVKAGHTRVRKGHPILKDRASLFEPLEVHYDIEQATSRPGERRAVPVVRRKVSEE